jgi:hypothetical protein
MEAENDQDTREGSNSQAQDSSDQTAPSWKLRDLRPEKDPMGARNPGVRAKSEDSLDD